MNRAMNKFIAGTQKLVLSCLAVSLLSACASSRIPDPTYSGALGYTASSNPELLAAHERHYQAEQQTVIAASDMMPQVSLNASVSSYLYDDLAPTSRSGSHDYGIGITWPIIRSVAAIKGVQAAQFNERAADAAVRLQENTLLVDIVTAIADHQRATRIAALREQKLARLQSYLRDQQQRLSAGEISETDLLQIRGRIETAKATSAQANALLAEAIARLTALGLGANHGIELANPHAHLPNSEDDAVTIAMANNPVITESTFRLSAAEHNTALAASELAPDLSLSVNLGQDGSYYSDSSSTITNSGSIRLGLSVPLFDGGKRIAELKVQESKVREMQYQTRGVTTMLEADVRGQWARYQAALAARRHAQSRESIAQQTLGGIQEALKIGARTVADELAAMDELTEARIVSTNAYFDSLVVGHQLIASLNRIANAYKLNG